MNALCSYGPSPSVELEKLTWKPSPGPHPSQPEARPTCLLLRAHLRFQKPRLLGPSLLLSPSSTCPAACWFSAPPETEPPTLLCYLCICSIPPNAGVSESPIQVDFLLKSVPGFPLPRDASALWTVTGVPFCLPSLPEIPPPPPTTPESRKHRAPSQPFSNPDYS